MSDRINQKTKWEITQPVFGLASVPSERFTLCILMPMRKAFRLFMGHPSTKFSTYIFSELYHARCAFCSAICRTYVHRLRVCTFYKYTKAYIAYNTSHDNLAGSYKVNKEVKSQWKGSYSYRPLVYYLNYLEESWFKSRIDFVTFVWPESANTKWSKFKMSNLKTFMVWCLEEYNYLYSDRAV